MAAGGRDWQRVCSVRELVPGRVVRFGLGRDESGHPLEGIVLRDPYGFLRAYINRCQHLPIPLDAGSGRFLDRDRRHLVCVTHGAAYRLEDGYCVSGPCKGKSLGLLSVEEWDGDIHVRADSF